MTALILILSRYFPPIRRLVNAPHSSKLYQEYERAFAEATGLPISLRPVESWQLLRHGKQNEGPFCALLAERSRLSDTVVSVRLEERLIGFLQTGQAFRRPPTHRQFERTARSLAKWGIGSS